MRAEEGDESIEQLAKDAAKAEDKLEKTVDDEAPGPGPKHRKE